MEIIEMTIKSELQISSLVAGREGDGSSRARGGGALGG